MFSIDRVSVPYSWNHTITYDPSRGKMPYLVEMLHASAISALYHPLEEKLEFSIHATIAKGTVHQYIRKRGVHDISVTTLVDFGANLSLE